MDSSPPAPLERLRTFCSVPGCLEPAEGFVGYAYAHPTRWNLCTLHLAPIRRELLALLRPHEPAAPAAPSLGRRP